MYSARAIPITEQEHFYLLPAIGRSAFYHSGENYSLIVEDGDDLEDKLLRLKGLWGVLDEGLDRNLVHNCFRACSLEKFRDAMKTIGQ